MSILPRRTPPRHAKPEPPVLFRLPGLDGGPGIAIPPSWLVPAADSDSSEGETA